MCGSASRSYPVAEVVQRVEEHDDMPILEPEVDLNQPIAIEVIEEGDLERQLIRSIEEAARENQRLIQTVRHFQEVIEEQTALLGRRIQEELDRGDKENVNRGDGEIGVVNVDDEMDTTDSNGQEGQSSSSSSS